MRLAGSRVGSLPSTAARFSDWCGRDGVGRVRVVGRGTLLGPEGTGFGVWFARGAGLRSYRSRPVGWGVGVGVGCGVGVWSLLENCIVDASICSFCAASPAFLGLFFSSEGGGRGVLDGVVAMSS